jgi:hypothetical protein
MPPGELEYTLSQCPINTPEYSTVYAGVNMLEGGGGLRMQATLKKHLI